MINVAVSGAAGRMGRLVVRAVAAAPDALLSGALEAAGNPALGLDAGELAGLAPIGVAVVDDPAIAVAGASVCIDFSSPAGALAAAGAAAAAGCAVLVATTGLSPEQKKRIEALSKKVPVLIASNTSLGMNLVFALAERAAAALSSYHAEIVEAHHARKKDSPSGTALRLAESVASARGWNLDEVAVYGRHGKTGERGDRELGIHAVRGGGIFGDHTLILAGEDEVVSISHRAMSRELFAQGALSAARYLAGARPGLYTMADVLGIS